MTDEALTQCIRSLRRCLGDDAARPRFIETVPKHGYRFVAVVENGANPGVTPAAPRPERRSAGEIMLVGGAGTVGGAFAGFIGGLFYGFAGAAQPLAPGVGAISVLLVLVSLTLLVAVVGGAGVAFGIALSDLLGPRHWRILGGALGGFLVGAMVKLLGVDAFSLLIGRSPGDITGPFEGALLGAAIGLAAWLCAGIATLRMRMVLAAVFGGIAGAVIVLLGGHMMGGSLDLLAVQFPASRLHLGRIGALVGETGFGPLAQAVTAALEGALFSACLIGAMGLARRYLDPEGA